MDAHDVDVAAFAVADDPPANHDDRGADAQPIGSGSDPMSTPATRIMSMSDGPTGATITVIGELDRMAVARLRVALAGCREAGAVTLLVDLSRVPRCDPSLARALAWARTQLRGLDGELTVIGATEWLRARLEVEARVLTTFRALSYRPETADQP